MVDKVEIVRAGMFTWMRTAYLLARKRCPQGIREWQAQMENALIQGYTIAGAERNSGPEGFLKYVVERGRKCKMCL